VLKVLTVVICLINSLASDQRVGVVISVFVCDSSAVYVHKRECVS